MKEDTIFPRSLPLFNTKLESLASAVRQEKEINVMEKTHIIQLFLEDMFHYIKNSM